MPLDDMVKHSEMRRAHCFFSADTPVSELRAFLYHSNFTRARCRLPRSGNGAEAFITLRIDTQNPEAHSDENLTTYLQHRLRETLLGEHHAVHLVSARYVDLLHDLPQKRDWTRDRYPLSDMLPPTAFNEREL